MNSINLKAYAKVNLSLDIVGLKENGYHLMEMVMQSVSLADDILIELVEEDGLDVICKPDVVSDMEDNIVTKVTRAFLEKANIQEYGIRITVTKEIPSGAGLGGGSSDGASVLIGLNKLFRKKYSIEELCEIGVKISADIPFCLVSKTSLVQGIGEIITPIKPLPKCYMVIVKPSFSTNTKEAFAKYDKGEITKHPETQNLISAINNGDIKTSSNYFYNVFEEALFDNRIQEIKDKLTKLNALTPIMTGSGSAVFGIYLTEDEARKSYFELCNEGYTVYIAETID